MEAPARSADHPVSAANLEITEINRCPIDAPVQQEIPPFLGEEAQEASWLSSHKYMVGAIAAAAAGIVALLFAR